MPRIRGTMQATFRTREVANTSKRAVLRAMREVAGEIEAQIRTAISIQGPPRSLPGEPPHKDTGRLHANFRVTAGSEGLNVWAMPYAWFLEGGTVNMDPRPFVGPIMRGRHGTGLLRKSWDEEIARRARRYTGNPGASKPKRMR